MTTSPSVFVRPAAPYPGSGNHLRSELAASPLLPGVRTPGRAPSPALGVTSHPSAPQRSQVRRVVTRKAQDLLEPVGSRATGGTSALATLHAPSPRLARGCGQHPLEVAGPFFSLWQDTEPQALGVTYWFDAPPDGEPTSVSVHLAGRFRGSAPAGRKDSFEVVGTVERVLPGSGPVALTVRVLDMPSGTWEVAATPVEPAPPGASARWRVVSDPRRPHAAAVGTTTFAPVARVLAPGVRLGAWPALVATGAALALLAQSLLAVRLGLPLRQLLPLSAMACLLGLVGAKAYYLATHRSEPVNLFRGMSIQGFVLVAVGTLLAGAFVLGLPVGAVLDVTAPGLLAGMAVGRLGCLLGGCCAGRPTTSRWGVWSSDRRLGVRRIPVQPMESTLALVLAGLTFLGVLLWEMSSDGAVFVAGIGAYTLGRQLLFPLRAIPRATAHGSLITLVVAGAALVAGLLVLVER